MLLYISLKSLILKPEHVWFTHITISKNRSIWLRDWAMNQVSKTLWHASPAHVNPKINFIWLNHALWGWSEMTGSAGNINVLVIVHMNVLDWNVPNPLEMGSPSRRQSMESMVLLNAVSFTSTSTSHEYDHEKPLPGTNQNHLLRRTASQGGFL